MKLEIDCLLSAGGSERVPLRTVLATNGEFFEPIAYTADTQQSCSTLLRVWHRPYSGYSKAYECNIYRQQETHQGWQTTAVAMHFSCGPSRWLSMSVTFAYFRHQTCDVTLNGNSYFVISPDILCISLILHISVNSRCDVRAVNTVLLFWRSRFREPPAVNIKKNLYRARN